MLESSDISSVLSARERLQSGRINTLRTAIIAQVSDSTAALIEVATKVPGPW